MSFIYQDAAGDGEDHQDILDHKDREGTKETEGIPDLVVHADDVDLKDHQDQKGPKETEGIPDHLVNLDVLDDQVKTLEMFMLKQLTVN